MKKEHNALLKVAMVAAFSDGGVNIPKFVEGQPTVLELDRELAAKVINGQRGKVAPPGSEVNFKLELNDGSKDSKLHGAVQGQDTKGRQQSKST